MDAGCGTGHVTARLLKRCAHVVALDYVRLVIDARLAGGPRDD